MRNKYVNNNNKIKIESSLTDYRKDVLKNSNTLKVGMVKTAKVVPVALKEDDFLYIRDRAISAGNVIENEDGTTKIIDINDIYKEFLNSL